MGNPDFRSASPHLHRAGGKGRTDNHPVFAAVVEKLAMPTCLETPPFLCVQWRTCVTGTEPKSSGLAGSAET